MNRAELPDVEQFVIDEIESRGPVCLIAREGIESGCQTPVGDLVLGEKTGGRIARMICGPPPRTGTIPLSETTATSGQKAWYRSPHKPVEADLPARSR